MIAHIIADHISVSDDAIRAAGGAIGISGINDAADAILAALSALQRADPPAQNQITKRVFDFIDEHDPFGDHFSEHDLRLIATLAPQPEDERLRKIIRQAVEAYDSGNLQLNSPEIGDPENDIPMHPWHEEWLHYARAAIIADERSRCQPCEGRGYFDSRHPGYSGHTTCSWCNGTGRASIPSHKRGE